MIRKFFCIVPVLLLALCFELKAQLVGSLGDVQKDERELYTMTKQMTQFIRRFNYEEDRFGNKIFPDDPEYRNLDKRKDILRYSSTSKTLGLTAHSAITSSRTC